MEVSPNDSGISLQSETAKHFNSDFSTKRGNLVSYAIFLTLNLFIPMMGLLSHRAAVNENVTFTGSGETPWRYFLMNGTTQASFTRHTHTTPLTHICAGIGLTLILVENIFLKM